jgi:hypothetical protein
MQASGIASYKKNRKPPATSRVLSFRALVDDLFDFLNGLFYVTDRLIRFALIAKPVVAGQRTRGFLDPALHDIRLATHGNVPSNLSGLPLAGATTSQPIGNLSMYTVLASSTAT